MCVHEGQQKEHRGELLQEEMLIEGCLSSGNIAAKSMHTNPSLLKTMGFLILLHGSET